MASRRGCALARALAMKDSLDAHSRVSARRSWRSDVDLLDYTHLRSLVSLRRSADRMDSRAAILDTRLAKGGSRTVVAIGPGHDGTDIGTKSRDGRLIPEWRRAGGRFDKNRDGQRQHVEDLEHCIVIFVSFHINTPCSILFCSTNFVSSYKHGHRKSPAHAPEEGFNVEYVSS